MSIVNFFIGKTGVGLHSTSFVLVFTIITSLVFFFLIKKENTH